MERRGFTIGVYVSRFGVTRRTVHRCAERGILERCEKVSSHRQRYYFSEVIARYLMGVGAMNELGMMDRELLRPAEIARRLGVCRTTVYRWFHEERFGGIKIGGMERNGMVRIFRDEFERYMREVSHETLRERWRRR